MCTSGQVGVHQLTVSSTTDLKLIMKYVIIIKYNYSRSTKYRFVSCFKFPFYANPMVSLACIFFFRQKIQ